MSHSNARTGASVPLLTQKLAQTGLYELLNLDGGFTDKKLYWSQRDCNECVLEEHPFGLDTSTGSETQLDHGVRLIACDGGTDTSVKAMKLMLGHHAAVHPVSGRLDFRLRIIRIRKAAEHWERPGQFIHDLYFELITCVGSFMCGGVNDHTGEGGYGGEQLEAIFRFIAALYDKPLEEVVIPQADAEPARRKLSAAYGKFVERKRSAVEA
ncbi:MAG: hypothetical protein AAB442_01920 [Patescibacteria group bacterium]